MAELKSNRLRNLDVGQKTRLAALVALAFSIFSAVVTAWLIWALWWNVHALKKAGVIPKLDASYDAVAAAAAVGRLDVLAVLLTLMSIIAAVSLIYGFTLFRSAATAAAIEEVERRLPIELAERMRLEGHLFVAAALRDDEVIARLQVRFTSLGIDDIDEAEEVDDDPNWEPDYE